MEKCYRCFHTGALHHRIKQLTPNHILQFVKKNVEQIQKIPQGEAIIVTASVNVAQPAGVPARTASTGITKLVMLM